MVKRSLFLTSPCRLSLRNRQMVVENQSTGEVRTVPIEDIGYVLVENQQVGFTIPLLNALSENNCAVVFCNAQHVPVSMLMNLESNAVQAETYKFQVEASLPLKKNLWKQLIEQKISNQAALMRDIGEDGDKLKPLYLNVKSGDADNREGVAAKIYWDSVFGNEFVRSRFGGDPNPLLNYGYSILRAATARAIMGSGLYPAFGLFHKNRYNAFPLADDLMEPYRPYVDQLVVEMVQSGHNTLTIETKQRLLSVLFVDVRFDDLTRPLQMGLSITTASLVRCLRGDSKRLELPHL